MNLEGPIYQRGLTLEAGGRIDLNFPKDWVTTQRVLKIFFDHDAGWDNRLLTKHDTEQMKFLLQGNSAKGDASRADRNVDTAVSDLTGQGILDDNGDIDWIRFEEVVSHNRNQFGKGQIRYNNAPDIAA